jgi:hypothetical protein
MSDLYLGIGLSISLLVFLPISDYLRLGLIIGVTVRYSLDFKKIRKNILDSKHSRTDRRAG